MKCEKCGKENVYVKDNVFVPPENTIYRKRICKDCGYEFFTVEFSVEKNDELAIKEWNKWHRISAKKAAKRKSDAAN